MPSEMQNLSEDFNRRHARPKRPQKSQLRASGQLPTAKSLQPATIQDPCQAVPIDSSRVRSVFQAAGATRTGAHKTILEKILPDKS